MSRPALWFAFLVWFASWPVCFPELDPGTLNCMPRITARLAVLTERDFRVFYTGYVTSLLGTAMSEIALTFAVLDSGGTPADLGYVFAAVVLPQVFFMIGGGVLADRLGRRPVMLTTDAVRLAVQGTLAASLFAGRPPIWLFIVLSGLLGTGEGFFTPALGGLRADIVPPDRRQDGNALLGVAQSGTAVLGPALAGILIAVTSPALVIAVDAASYGVSVLALAALSIAPAGPAGQSAWRDLADGWRQFRGQTWLWLTTVQFALFNLFTWAPFLLLGPILARDYLGGARAWGIVTACLAAGAVLAGLALVGRRPQRPLVIGAIGTFGYGFPGLMLAVHADVALVAAGAAAAGAGGAVCSTYYNTVMQQRVPQQMLARTTAFASTGSYALGASGYAVIGLVAAPIGLSRLLGFGAAYAFISSTVVLGLPAIRSVRWRAVAAGRSPVADPVADPGADPGVSPVADPGVGPVADLDLTAGEGPAAGAELAT
jgi:MFS family permease